jgi:hypothetical protein
MQDQIANLAGHLDGTLPLRLGATVDGPASSLSGSGTVSGMNICPSANPFATFNGQGAQYIDNVAYWMTVEPSLDYTVPTALLWAQLIGEPLSATSAVLQFPGMIANGFQFTVTGAPGANYAVQTSTNLTDWQPLQTNAAPFVFTDNSINATTKFYRALYVP